MADSRLPTGPRFLEPHLRQRVSEKTLKKYRDEILPLSVWSLERQCHSETAEEWDDLFVEYLLPPRLEPSKILYASGWSRVLLSEVPQPTLLVPRRVSGWETGAQVRHTVPLGKGVAKLIMVHSASC